MSVEPAELTTPERGMTRRTRKSVAPTDDVTAGGAPTEVDPADELAALKARIEAARALQEVPHPRHCSDCWKRGRDAALRAIEGTLTS